jgi:Ser/Thr protein kinase RdoA (MazF antagonist)
VTVSPQHLIEAERTARDLFGVVGAATPLGGYSDTNTRIDTSEGVRYVLRISPEGTDVARLLQSETVMAAASKASFATPHPVRTSHDERWATLANGQIARLHTWVPGATYGASGHPPAAARSVGRTAGEMVGVLAEIEPSTSQVDSKWDIRSASATITSLRSRLGAEHQQSLIQEVLDRLLRVNTKDLPLQMVHNDLNPGILLLSDDIVHGVIDFGDATRTYRIAELAIACAYAMLDQDDPVFVATEACRGYLEFTSITGAEADSLLDFVLARLATSVCISASQPRGNPQHHDTESMAWNLLARLILGDTDRISREIADAARQR